MSILLQENNVWQMMLIFAYQLDVKPSHCEKLVLSFCLCNQFPWGDFSRCCMKLVSENLSVDLRMDRRPKLFLKIRLHPKLIPDICRFYIIKEGTLRPNRIIWFIRTSRLRRIRYFFNILLIFYMMTMYTLKFCCVSRCSRVFYC